MRTWVVIHIWDCLTWKQHVTLIHFLNRAILSSLLRRGREGRRDRCHEQARKARRFQDGQKRMTVWPKPQG